MLTEIKRVGVVRTGKVCAILYGFIGLILLPFALLAMLGGSGEGIGLFIMAVLYPILGFIGGILGAALYNLAANLGGGFQLELEQVAEAPGYVVPQGPPDIFPQR